MGANTEITMRHSTLLAFASAGWAVAAAMVMTGMSQPSVGSGRVLKAERFELTDKAGKTQVTIGLEDGRPSIAQWKDGTAYIKVTLSVEDGVPQAVFDSPTGRSVAILRKDGDPRYTYVIPSVPWASPPREYRTVVEYDRFKDITTCTLKAPAQGGDHGAAQLLELSATVTGRDIGASAPSVHMAISAGGLHTVTFIIDGVRTVEKSFGVVGAETLFSMSLDDVEKLANASSVEFDDGDKGQKLSDQQRAAMREFVAFLRK